MGILEAESRRKRRIGYVQQAILSAVAVGGIMAVAMVAPNIFQAIPRLIENKYKFNYRARSAAARLAEKGYVRFIERSGKKCIEITPAGTRALALEAEKVTLRTRAKRRWDKRWRMIMFDIPEGRRRTRVRLRETMREMSFLRLQDSVWIFPYDCEDVITLLKADLHIGKDALYAIVEKLENDTPIRKHFGLL